LTPVPEPRVYALLRGCPRAVRAPAIQVGRLATVDGRVEVRMSGIVEPRR